MPEDAARKSIIREFMRETGLRYTAARRELDEPPGPPFDPGWLNLEITLCPVCGGDTVYWLLRPDSLMAPEPGEMLGYTKPVDPGFCRGCHASGDSHTPDLWRLHKDLDPGHCIECGQPPVTSRHLPGIDGKHRRNTNYDDSLAPADGRWYRYECPAQHWWISAPIFRTVPPIIY